MRRRFPPAGCSVPFPSGSLPGISRPCGPRGLSAFCGPAVLSAPIRKKNMRKRPLRVAVFPASGFLRSAPQSMRLEGARPPLFLLVRRRSGSRPERGWCGLCALGFRSWSVSVCACVWLALDSPGPALVLGGCTVAALGRGGFLLAAFGRCWCAVRGRKNRE